MISHQVIVALEGIDGAGKSTLIKLLNAEFKDIVGTYSRTKKGAIFNFIVSRKIMQKHLSLQIPIYLFLSLKNYITLGKRRHKPIILMDRCFLSNFCYFYFDALFNEKEFRKKLCLEVGLMPQKIFIIDVDPLIAYHRDKKKKQINWLITTREHYLQAKGSPLMEKYHIEIINPSLTIEEKKEKIANYIRREMHYGN